LTAEDGLLHLQQIWTVGITSSDLVQPSSLIVSPKRGALKLQFPHSDYQVVSRLGKAPAILSTARRLEGAIPELSNDMPEMKVLKPSPLKRKRGVGTWDLGEPPVFFNPFENDPSTYYLLDQRCGDFIIVTLMMQSSLATALWLALGRTHPRLRAVSSSVLTSCI
jgi:hypothetical protein